MKFSKIAILVVALFYITINSYKGFWTDPVVLKSDVVDYYSYLPSMFIYKDAGMKFIDEDPDFFAGKIWGHKLENGNYVVKTTMGMSILYSPFFFAGHIYAHVTHHEPNGFSTPYAGALAISSLFYFLLGLVFIRKLLLRFFNETSTGITLIVLSLATNITLYLTVQPALSHAYNFFLFALFLYLIPVWYNKQSIRNSAFIGLCFGLITLIRPTNGLLALVFIFWDIDNISALKTRIHFFIKNILPITIIALTCFAMWIPQFIFWKLITGQFMYYSYGEEGFFFLQPQIYKVLLSFRKGWLIYTPVMVFSLIGFVQIFKNYRKLFVPLFIFFILNLYVISSWWCWWYGGSYGHRAFIDSYPLMAIPLAAFIGHNIPQKIWKKILFYLFCAFFVFLNLFQTRQYLNSAIHWDSMTRSAYFETLWKSNPTDLFYYLLEAPDYESALKGLPEQSDKSVIHKIVTDNLLTATYFNDYEFVLLHMNDFEVLNEANKESLDYISNYMKFTGETSYLTNNIQHYLPTFSIAASQLKALQVKSIMAEYIVFSFDTVPAESLHIVISIEDENEAKYYYSSSSTSTQIVPGQWNIRNFWIDLPSDLSDDLTMKCYIWNNEGRAQVYIDNFKVYGLREQN